MRARLVVIVGVTLGASFVVGCGCSDVTTGNGTDAGPEAGRDTGPAPDGARDTGPRADAPGADTGAGCGDGRMQTGEVCDDGNTVDGDGCSADCTSDETCGNGHVDQTVGELCDDGNSVDGDTCRGDCLSDYRCGNDVVDTLASGASADEACDDGNTANGDGCSADCLSDETCGNGTIDVGAGEVCDDGNTVDGDECSADCHTSTLCGNGSMDGTEECDDHNHVDGDGCNAMCQVERCGNGRVDASEQCDDANTTDGDGCDTDCTFTCSNDAACSDGNVCNGTETCTSAGTTASRCAAGTPAADGTSCGGARICRSGMCTTAGCGDGVRTGTEQCDDGNMASGDGCDGDCTWTCTAATVAADCGDGNACNGTETCTNGGTLMSRCGAGTPLAVGAACDRDGMPATRDICRAGNACLASSCGDGFPDPGATPAEQCDDGNRANNDGCSATCTIETATPPTGFRITQLRLISPRITVAVPLGGCQDITDNCPSLFGGCQADSVNTLLANALNPTSTMNGDYSLHIVSLFRPYSTTTATTPADIHVNAACMEMPTPDACGPDATAPNVVMSSVTNTTMGACFTPVAAEVNTRAGTPASYTPGVNTVTGPCFLSDPEMLMIDIGGIAVPLRDATLAATYSGTMPSSRRLVSGVVRGFLSEADAIAATLPASLPLVGGDPLYEHLQAGNRTVMMHTDGCNVGGGTNEDDADMNGTTRGFWFFLNFTAEEITWSGP